MESKAITRNSRMSAQKGRPLARKVQGKTVTEALAIVSFSPRKAAVLLKKTLESAIANARQRDANADVDALRVAQVTFDEGPRLKRYWPRARGSASPIQRRLCHVKVILSDEIKA